MWFRIFIVIWLLAISGHLSQHANPPPDTSPLITPTPSQETTQGMPFFIPPQGTSGSYYGNGINMQWDQNGGSYYGNGNNATWNQHGGSYYGNGNNMQWTNY
jgi:hypothetical protein